MAATTSEPGHILMAIYRPDPTLLARQIASIAAQTERNWHCTLGVDGADPATEQLARELVADDPRFTVVSYPDRAGVYRHFERLLSSVSPLTPWFALSDQDDVWHSDKLFVLRDRLFATGASAVTSQARVVNTSGEVLARTQRRTATAHELVLNNQVTGAFSMFRRDVLCYALPFPESTSMSMHDHWLGVCAQALGGVEVVGRPLQDYVQHGNNVLGEARRPSIYTQLGEVRRIGGVSKYLESHGMDRWRWRLVMSRALLDRRVVPDVQPAMSAIAANRWRPAMMWLLIGAVFRRRLSARAAVGMAIAIRQSASAAIPR